MSYIISRPWGGCCGIGHEFCNWVVAWQLACHYGLRFVHAPFCGYTLLPGGVITEPVALWEQFLGFGKNEFQESQLPNNIRRIELPFLPWEADSWLDNVCCNDIWKQIIEKHIDNDVLFECAQNQFMRLDQQALQCHVLRTKYMRARDDQPVSSVFDNSKINVAIHIRRGDIKPGKDRWVETSVHAAVIDQIADVCGGKAVFHIYSIGTVEELKELQNKPNVIFHLCEDVFDTFHHMVIADILMIGKGSFSALAAHLSNNIKISQSWDTIPDYPCGLKKSNGHSLWEHFPSDQHFVSMDNVGQFNADELMEKIQKVCIKT